MTLLTRVTNLRTAAVAVDDVVKIKTRTGDLRTLSDRLGSPARELPTLITALTELASIDASLDSDSVQDAAETVAALRSLATTLPGLPIDAALELPKSQVKSVENLTKKLALFVDTHWGPFREQELPAINEELVEALAAGGVDVEDVRNKLIGAHSTILGIRYRSIPQEGDVARFSEALATLRACGEEISTLVDPTLAEGILKSQTEGISLSWFTPERIAAVTDLGILDRFRVRLT
ncbi:hypothetical protein ACOACQ_19070 [Nocardioides sp. CPCC 206347]|uniref:hypothetical protein n=1 Tax=unclassified Nocardioides TaxID=2615069 RepID=UPI00361B38D5